MSETPSEQATLAGPTAVGGLETLHSGQVERPSPIELGRGPTRLGRYVLLSKLGEGGMGVVYAAFDEQLDRKVAIKLLHARTDALAQHRLIREAQALARLSHPNVVQVYEIVELGDSAFIVMEFVDGLTLRHWLSQTPRTWRAIVDVFVAAGRGLAAAHTKGLVHRDFKPDNVMVDDEGRVRVMDFGLAHAKLTELGSGVPVPALASHQRSLESSSSLTNDLTVTGSLMGTPAYMAPEQCRGLDTDARTDQFSFSVSLWEALYGQRPFGGGNLAALTLAIVEGRVREPPRAADVPTWLRRVVERGLAVEPDRRWPSMASMQAALERDPTRRRAFALGSIATLTAVALGVFAVGRARDREREQTLATCEASGRALDDDWNPAVRDRLEQAFLATELGFAAETWQRTSARMDDYANHWSELKTANCVATELEHSREPTLRVWVDECLDERRAGFAALIEQLGQPDTPVLLTASTSVAKLPELETCTDERWLAQRVRPPDDAGTREQVARLRARLAQVRALELTGRYTEGVEAARVVLGEAEALGWAPLDAEARFALGRLLGYAEDNEGSRIELERAFYLAGQTGHDLVALRSAIDLIAVTQGEPARMWGRIGEMLVARLGAHGEFDEAALLVAIGNAHHDRGEYREALAAQQQALAIFAARMGPDHPLTSAALNNIGNAQSSLADYPAARATYRRALAMAEAWLGPTHPGVAMALMNLGILERDIGDRTAASAHFARALAIDEAALGNDHPQVARILNAIGNLAVDDGQPSEALRSFERVHAIWSTAFGATSLNVGIALNNIGNAQWQLGQNPQSLDSQNRALALIEGALGPDHPNLSYPLTSRARVLRSLGQFDAAIEDDQRALDVLLATLGDDKPETAGALLGLGLAYAGKQRYDLAIESMRRSLAIRELMITSDEEVVEAEAAALRDVVLEANAVGTR